MTTIPTTMQAAVIGRFGGPEELTIQTVPVPQVSSDEVLIQVAIADVGSWDATERKVGYDGVFGMPAHLPYILGADVAGIIAAVGDQVKGFAVGDRVDAASMPLPKGGFYAEYALVAAEHVMHVPSRLSTEQAGVMAWD